MILNTTRAEKADALSRLHHDSFETGWSADAIAECLNSPGGFGVTASLANVAIGFVLARAIAGEAEILTLAVAPAHRRQGVARRLLDAAGQIARAAGAETLFLEVARDNAAAVALYETNGFTQTGLRRGYYQRPGRPAGDALVLHRRLNSAPA